jgi:hypothetical protein
MFWWAKRPLGRPKHRLDITAKIHCKEMGWKDADWINMAEDTKGGFLYCVP